MVAPFVAWLRDNNLNPLFPEELDDLMMEYKVDENITKSNFEALVAATEFVFPAWRGKLAWCRASLTGWKVSHETQHTTPLPRALAFLVASHLAARGNQRLAVGLVVQQAAGLRPSELLALIKEDVSLPELQLSAKRSVVVLGLGIRTGTKAKRAQTAIVEVPLLISLLRWVMHYTAPGDRLFPSSYSQYRKLLSEIVNVQLKLDLKITPHSPRAGFASDAISDGVPFQIVMALG